MTMKLPKIRLPSAAKIEGALRETCLVAGFLMFAHGLWLIYPPAMYVICGLALYWFGASDEGVHK